jgi:hypothetical protein
LPLSLSITQSKPNMTQQSFHCTLLLEAEEILSGRDEKFRPDQFHQSSPPLGPTKKPKVSQSSPTEYLSNNVLLMTEYYPPVTHYQQMEYRQNWKRKFRPQRDPKENGEP